MALQAGVVAPDFTLRSKNKDGLTDVTLSSHRGKDNVVLLFLPGAFTPVCTQEMCDATKGMSEYEALSAKVYGVSPDSPFALEAWSFLEAIEVPMLSDYHHKVTQAYDVVWPDFAGNGPGTARAVFLIDKEGMIRYSEQTASLGDMPNIQALKDALSTL